MICLDEPDVSNKPWILSHIGDKNPTMIPKEIIRSLKRYHVQAIDFLYQNYTKQFKGAILNEENGFNMQLQVSTFLNAVLKTYVGKFLVLVLCPDNLVVNWHYHLSCHGKMKVEIVKPSTCFADFDQEDAVALLVSFSAVRLSEPLADYQFFSVIIDHLDSVTTKRGINKLCGDFNIGLTHRSFYIDPDQRLQWQMLNWCNPGCVGKLSDFYEVDNDNFVNFRDNYRHWWFRLTWNFDDAFTKISEEEQMEYASILAKWSTSHNITLPIVEETKKIRKRISAKPYHNSNGADNRELENKPIKVRKVENTDRCVPQIETVTITPSILVPKQEEELETVTDTPTILEPKQEEEIETMTCSQTIYLSDNDETSNEHNVLLDIMNDKNPSVSPTMDQEARILIKKEELLSQVFDDNGDDDDNDIPTASSNFLESDEDKDFFRSFI